MYERQHTPEDYIQATRYFYRIGNKDAQDFILRRMRGFQELEFLMRCGITPEELNKKGLETCVQEHVRRLVIWAKLHDIEPEW